MIKKLVVPFESSSYDWSKGKRINVYKSLGRAAQDKPKPDVLAGCNLVGIRMAGWRWR
jgi:hypothetical protein